MAFVVFSSYYQKKEKAYLQALFILYIVGNEE